jgi:hypothetical protein
MRTIEMIRGHDAVECTLADIAAGRAVVVIDDAQRT